MCETAKRSNPTARGQALRFIAFGGLNTLVTYALYCALVTSIAMGVGPRTALAISLVIVTPLSFALNRAVLTRRSGRVR